ncbi:MAG: hypothetical protein V3573_10490 [Desulfovibrionaceae bacterium]
MNSTKDTIHPSESKKRTANHAFERGETFPFFHDLSRISLIISLLSLCLVLIFFFGLSRNLNGLSREVQSYNALKNSVVSLDAYVDDLLGQMGKVNAQLLDMDEHQRQIMLQLVKDNMLDDMLQKTSFLEGQLNGTPDGDKLARLRSVLEELRHTQKE